MTILDQPQQTYQQIVYASFGERLVARLIDGIILILPSMFVPFILPWLYFALQEGNTSGATIGKRAMGIRVVSEDGQTIGFGTATGRFFGHLLDMFTFFIGYFLMLFNARSQCLHDMITSTIVIKHYPGASQRQKIYGAEQKQIWTNKVGDSETHFVEIDAKGGRHWHGSQVNEFTLWQLTDGMVDFSAEFGSEINAEMKRYAEQILRGKI